MQLEKNIIALDKPATPQSVSLSKCKRSLYLLLGFVSAGLGILGMFLPLLPTTCFMILASFAFSKSSPRFQKMLHAQKGIGPVIKNWEENRIIRREAKIKATTAIFIFGGFSIYLIANKILLCLLVSSILISVIIYIWQCREQVVQ